MKKKSVLVIEDSSFLAESLVDMLELSNYQALVAPNGKEGVTIALSKKPDLILLDIRLPDIDGYEVYRRIRQTAWGKNALIVVLTASESSENISKNIDLPSEFVLFKPEWSVVDLLAKIDSLVN
jgi:two-component system KDP operon response regulator KdpE